MSPASTENSIDVVYLQRIGVLNYVGKRLKGQTGPDAVALYHPDAPERLFTVVDFKDNTAQVIIAGNLRRRYTVLYAVSEKFNEDIARSVLAKTVTNKRQYFEGARDDS